MENLKTNLTEELNTTSSELRKRIIEDILDQDDSNYPDSMQDYIESVTNGGISGGCVSGLIYYKDTNAFFDEHYAEIADIIDEYQDETGEALKIDGDMKNFYAWFAYEWVMNDIYREFVDP